ncbi:MAG: HAD family hydrolase [Parcubacteria group bacterium]|nr:HAD family hydrolase [Parcubacteria group bacterium]
MHKLVIFDWGRTLWNPETQKLFNKVPQVLEFLTRKGYTLSIVALATDGDTKRRLDALKASAIEDCFAKTLFRETGKDKMYKETLKELKFESSETIIIDDRVVRGIKFANKYGCKSIWIQSLKFREEYPTEETGKPTYTIDKIGQLIDIL